MLHCNHDFWMGKQAEPETGNGSISLMWVFQVFLVLLEGGVYGGLGRGTGRITT